MESQSFKYDPFLKNNKNTLSVTIMLECKQHTQFVGLSSSSSLLCICACLFFGHLKTKCLTGLGAIEGRWKDVNVKYLIVSDDCLTLKDMWCFFLGMIVSLHKCLAVQFFFSWFRTSQTMFPLTSLLIRSLTIFWDKELKFYDVNAESCNLSLTQKKKQSSEKKIFSTSRY